MNVTMNGSGCHSLDNSTAQKIGKTFAYCLLIVVSLIGNCLIAIIVYRTQTMRRPINFFIVNMAMSDLLYPIFLLPRILTQLYVGSWLISGPLGQTLCKLINSLSSVSLGVSAQSLVLIAVDRFGAVIFPLRSPLISSNLCPLFIVLTWVIAMTFLSPFWFAFKLVEYSRPGKLACMLQWNEAFGESSNFDFYKLAIYVVLFYIPVFLITMLYVIILYKLKTQKIPGEQTINADEQRARRNRNVLKMAIAIVLGFILCWVPVTIVTLPKNRGYWPCDTAFYDVVGVFMASANSAINPCICFVFSGNYRHGLYRIFSRHAQKPVRCAQLVAPTPNETDCSQVKKTRNSIQSSGNVQNNQLRATNML